MKAFVMKSIGEVEFTEKEKPTPGLYDAILKPTKGLVCTSDIHTVHGSIGERKNLTLGHEVVGHVDKVGEKVEDFKPGDRVVVGAITPDWGSKASQDGYPSQSNQELGGWKFANTKDGTFSEYVHVNHADANLAKIPNSIQDEEAVYTTDMISTGVKGAEKANIPVGGTVVIFAQGPVGLMATKGAELQGAGKIFTVETISNRQELSKKYGADEVIDFEETDPVEYILEETNGEGVDSAIEALGNNQTFQDCIKVTKPGGTISNIGYHGQGEYVNIPRKEWGVGMAEKTINTSLCPGGRVRLNRLLRLIDKGKIDPRMMTTHEFKFSEIDKAFELMESKEDQIIKPLIKF